MCAHLYELIPCFLTALVFLSLGYLIVVTVPGLLIPSPCILIVIALPFMFLSPPLLSLFDAPLVSCSPFLSATACRPGAKLSRTRAETEGNAT